SGASHIKVGEAALCIDPLSSQGVQRAMVSALQAAAVVNTALRSPGHAQLACRFYRDRLHEFAQSDLDASAAYYNQQAQICPTDFWLQRANRAVSKPAISPHHLHAPSAD